MLIPQQIQEHCRRLFKKDIQYAAALRIINRIYCTLMHHNSNYTPTISRKYVMHMVSNQTASKILRTLIENDIIYIARQCHADSHTARSYGLTWLRNQEYIANRTILSVNIKDYLTELQYRKYELKTNVHLLSLKSIQKDQQIRQQMMPQTLLLIDRLQNVRFNPKKLRNYCLRYFPLDNPDTLLYKYTQSADEDKRKKQLQYVYLAGIINGLYPIQVIKGKKGGRLHHPLCHISKELWQMLEPINEEEHKLSIDLNACQVACLDKIVPLPSICKDQLSKGRFYQYINERMYNGKKTRQQVKKLVFSQLFNGSKRFASKFSKISPEHKLFIDELQITLQVLKEQNITLASQLQLAQSNIFNKLYHQTERSIVRYDQLVVIGNTQYIEEAASKIIKQLNQYFGFNVSLHISIDNQQVQ